MQKNMQKKCAKMPEQKCQKKNLKKGKKFQKKNMSKDGIMVAHLFSNWKVMGSNLYLERLFFQVRKLLRDS